VSGNTGKRPAQKEIREKRKIGFRGTRDPHRDDQEKDIESQQTKKLTDKRAGKGKHKISGKKMAWQNYCWGEVTPKTKRACHKRSGTLVTRGAVESERTGGQGTVVQKRKSSCPAQLEGNRLKK